METGSRPRICVYCASRKGDDPVFEQTAVDAGRILVAKGVDLVYGGGHVGLMGVIADTVTSGGGHVTGVIPQHLVDMEEAHPGLEDLRIVTDMAERKRTMFVESDAFLTLPGGIGTMEEMFEVLTWHYLGLHSKPVGLLNADGYYDDLIAFLDNGLARGLMSARARSVLMVSDDAEELIDSLLVSVAGLQRQER